MRWMLSILELLLCLYGSALAHPAEIESILPEALQKLSPAEMAFLQQIPAAIFWKDNPAVEAGSRTHAIWECQHEMVEALRSFAFARRPFPLGATSLENGTEALIGTLIALIAESAADSAGQDARMVAGRVVRVQARRLEGGPSFEVTLLHKPRSSKVKHAILSTFNAGDLSRVFFIDSPEALQRERDLSGEDLRALGLDPQSPHWSLLPPVAFQDELLAARTVLQGALVRSQDWGGRVLRATARSFGFYQVIVLTPHGLSTELASAQELRIYCSDPRSCRARFNHWEFAFFHRLRALEPMLAEIAKKEALLVIMERYLREQGEVSYLFPESFYEELRELWQGTQTLEHRKFAVEDLAERLAQLITFLARPHVLNKLVFGSMGGEIVRGKIVGFRAYVPVHGALGSLGLPGYEVFVETPDGVRRFGGLDAERHLKAFTPYRFGLP